MWLPSRVHLDVFRPPTILLLPLHLWLPLRIYLEVFWPSILNRNLERTSLNCTYYRLLDLNLHIIIGVSAHRITLSMQHGLLPLMTIFHRVNLVKFCKQLTQISMFTIEWLRFHKGDIHTHKHAFCRGIPTLISLLTGGVTHKNAFYCPWVQFPHRWSVIWNETCTTK
jgi:hypothetical protein